MTKDDIIRMAREAGLERNGYWEFDMNRLEAFANLVAAHKAEVALAEAYRCGYEAGVVEEREECAKLAREIGNATEPDDWALDKCDEIETAIRAR